MGREKKLFSRFMRHYLENGTEIGLRTKLLLMTFRKLNMRFRLAPELMTLDDPELEGGQLPLFSNT